jgi:hypothetical protein
MASAHTKIILLETCSADKGKSEFRISDIYGEEHFSNIEQKSFDPEWIKKFFGNSEIHTKETVLSALEDIQDKIVPFYGTVWLDYSNHVFPLN